MILDSSRLSPYSLAVVAPFHNEEAGAANFYRTLVSALEPLGLRLYFIFVDDGSKDATLEVLNALAAGDPRIQVLALSRNFGHQIALTAGLDHADADAVVTMDSDLQHPPQAIPEMFALFEQGLDVVYGVRVNDNTRGMLKQVLARIYYDVMRRVTDVQFIQGSVDFRLMSREVVDALCCMRETHRYLRGMVPWLGFKHGAVPYQQMAREYGASSYTWRRLIRLAEAGFFSFSTFPLRLITWIGLGISGLAGLYFLYVLVSVYFLRFATAPEGWVSVIASLLLLSGVQLVSIGVLARYMSMIFEEVKDRPLYVLRKRSDLLSRDGDLK
jgi:polyisoprenyl-phosphate glycosyltransferase